MLDKGISIHYNLRKRKLCNAMRLKMAFIHYGIAVNDSIQDCKETAEVKEVIGKVDPHIFFDLRLALG